MLIRVRLINHLSKLTFIQADIHGDEASYRKIKLVVEDVQGKQCLTNFHGMGLTRDKTCSMIKKWHSLIEASTDVMTTDGYKLRLFTIGFTKKLQGQLKKTSYAQHAQVSNFFILLTVSFLN